MSLNLIKKFIIKDFNEITMKLEKLIASVNPLSTEPGSLSCMDAILKEKLPVVLGFKISLFLKKVNPEIEEYNKKRNELLLEHSDVVLDEEGKETNQYKFKTNDDLKVFNEEVMKLLEQEITVEVPEIHITDFANTNIEPRYLVNLADWFIKE